MQRFPVDVLVAALWLNANRPRALIAPFMSLRLRAMLTPERIGITAHVGPEQFWAAAKQQGYDLRFIKAFVPPDIRELVESMHKDFDAPPEVASCLLVLMRQQSSSPITSMRNVSFTLFRKYSHAMI